MGEKYVHNVDASDLTVSRIFLQESPQPEVVVVVAVVCG